MEDKKTLSALGTRLRAVRKSQNYSLSDIEELSKGSFKAVVLGSYERGARAMTVARLVELAEIYQVPISTFLEGENHKGTLRVERTIIDTKRVANRAKQSDRYNLESYKILARYLREIIYMRQDWNGQVISLRTQDFENLALCLDMKAAEFHDWLTLEELTLHKPL